MIRPVVQALTKAYHNRFKHCLAGIHAVPTQRGVSLESISLHSIVVESSGVKIVESPVATPQAFTLYRKTRPGASLESIKRARDLGLEGIHPLLARELDAAQLGGWFCCPHSAYRSAAAVQFCGAECGDPASHLVALRWQNAPTLQLRLV